jgi:hypothetical protein
MKVTLYNTCLEDRGEQEESIKCSKGRVSRKGNKKIKIESYIYPLG